MRGLGACTVLLAACFSPQPPVGAQCANGVCPSGLACLASTNTCEKPGTPGTIDAALAADAALLDTPPAPDAQACFGSGVLSICPAAPVTQPLAFVNATTIDTDTSPSCIAYAGAADDLCVIAGTTVDIARPLRATGTKALVILATDAITIDTLGAVDVSSTVLGVGAAANPTACVAGAAASGQQGGPGGSFGGIGGRGAGLGTTNGPQAAAAVATPVMTLRGGCKGGNGAGQQVVPGGNGGGAVALIANASITVLGSIHASGAGGNGAAGRSGGGGGGSGGMIVLDAPMISVATAASVYANGGGGGEGGTPNHGGRRGGDVTSATTAASGGNGNSNHGGAGGTGAVGATRNGGGASGGQQCTGTGGNNGKGGGAGGGGGSAGIVRIFATTEMLSGTISPAAN